MNRIWWRRVVGLLAVVFAACAPLRPVAVSGGELALNFSDVFSGTAPGSSSLPWTQALFQDVAPGVVSLTLANLSLNGSENVDKLYFNLNPSLDPGELTFTRTGGNGSYALPSIDLGANAFTAAGAKDRYDIRLLFNHGGSDAARFGANESLVYQISGLSNLTAADFNFQSQFGDTATGYYAVEHVQRIGPNGAFSGWLEGSDPPIVPEPQPALLLFVGLAVFVVQYRVRGVRVS